MVEWSLAPIGLEAQRKTNAKQLQTDSILSSWVKSAELQTVVHWEGISKKTQFKLCLLENYQVRELGWELMDSMLQTSLFMPVT